MGPISSRGRIIGQGNFAEAKAMLKKAGKTIATSQRIVFHFSRFFFSEFFIQLRFLSLAIGSVHWISAKTPNNYLTAEVR